MLSDAEVEGLDRLLAAYRRPRFDKGYCTSSNKLFLRWYRGNWMFRSENLSDHGCVVEETAGVLPMWKVVVRSGAGRPPPVGEVIEKYAIPKGTRTK